MHAGMKTLIERIESIRAGEHVSLPWREIDHHINGLAARTLTIVCGSPGASKSWGAIQCIRHWHATGTPWAACLLEDTIGEHIERMAVQECSASWMTSDHQLSMRSDEALAAMDGLTELATIAEKQIRCTDRKNPPTPESLHKWAREQCEQGARAIIVDPLTMIRCELDPWRLAEKICDLMIEIACQYKARIILVTHPKDGNGKSPAPLMGNIAGGKAYERFAHNVLWLEYIDQTEATMHDGSRHEINRVMHVLKSRRGHGPARFGMWFDGADLTLNGRGKLQRKGKAI
jgi:hypothetical protein